MAQVAVQVEILAVAVSNICIVRGEYRGFHGIKVVLYVLALLGGNILIVRRLDGDRRTLCRVEIDLLGGRGIGVNLNEVATREVCTRIIRRLHLGDVDTMLAHIYLVAELIATPILAIDNNIYGVTEGCVS